MFCRKPPEDGGRFESALEDPAEHYRSAKMGSDTPTPITLVPLLFFFCPLFLLLYIAGYTLPSADGKQITSSIKGLLSVHRHMHKNTHTYTVVHKITRPLQGRGCVVVGG